MKPFDENDLIAYHLQELSPRRARALEKAMQADPSLAAESENYATMLRSFKGAMPLDVDEEIMDRNWSRIWSKLPRQPLRPASLRRWLIPILAGVGVAFAATAFFITTRHSLVTTSIGPLDKPIDHEVAQSSPSVENPFSKNVLPENAGKPPRILLQRSPYVVPLTNHSVERLRLFDGPSRIIHPIPDLGGSPTALKFIPLARAPFPLSITPELPRVAIVPEPPQESSTTAKRKHSHAIHRDHPMDVTLAMGGMLIGTREFTKNGVGYSQGATHAVTALSSFHQQLRPLLGYRISVSYSRPDFLYGQSTVPSDINGRIFEVAGTYVVQGPHRGIVSTAAEGGAGVMAISPTVTSADTGNNLRVAAVVGVSAEFAVSKHLAIQTSYRMQVFKGPDFQSASAIAPIATTTLISNEPMVGITYRFSRK